MNIPKPRIKLLIVIAAAGLVFAGGLTWWLATHDKKATQQPVTQNSPADNQAATNTSEPTATPAPAQTGTGATKPSTATPAPAPQPAPANITHPTAANCPATGQKTTIYASVEAGTPAYLDHPVYRDSSNTVAYTYPYKTAISNVFCDDSHTAFFLAKEKDHYFRFNFSDVSVTLP